MPKDLPRPPLPQGPPGTHRIAGTIAQPMTLLDKGDFYEGTDYKFEYNHTKVIFTDGAGIYYARVEHRVSDGDVALTELRDDAILITTEEVTPIAPKDVTIAPEPLPNNCYVKRPDLLRHIVGSDVVRNLLLQEALVCENFIRSPHVNLAKYYGCVVESGRIAGLCFAKYANTLAGKATEPGGLQVDRMQGWLNGIKQGIDHLHSLGLAHNDLNPYNIMFMEGDDDTPVIIDFDSCQADGDAVGIKVGSVGWMPEGGLRSSMRENDYFGLKKIEEFLAADTVEQRISLLRLQGSPSPSPPARSMTNANILQAPDDVSA